MIWVEEEMEQWMRELPTATLVDTVFSAYRTFKKGTLVYVNKTSPDEATIFVSLDESISKVHVKHLEMNINVFG